MLRSPGRAGRAIVPGSTIRQRGALRTMATPGNPRGRTIRCTSPRQEGGRRRAIGGVAVLHVASARPRRWRDTGTPAALAAADQKAGALGSRHRPAAIVEARLEIAEFCYPSSGIEATSLLRSTMAMVMPNMTIRVPIHTSEINGLVEASITRFAGSGPVAGRVGS